MELCKDCGYLHYKTDPCRIPKKSVDAKAERIVPRRTAKNTTRPTDANSEVAVVVAKRQLKASSRAVSSQSRTDDPAHQLSKPKRGRPKIHADRKAYKAQKQREYRAKLKAHEGER